MFTLYSLYLLFVKQISKRDETIHVISQLCSEQDVLKNCLEIYFILRRYE